MLHPMQQTVAPSPSPASPTFAGLLAALTAPTPRTAWNNDDLADDVATLSYEHALRTHARYKYPAIGESAPRSESIVEPATRTDTSQNLNESEIGTANRAITLGVSESGFASFDNALFERNKKCSSVTIRLSKEECEQLRRRAAQAGLTVSAYLRSCTFEAETLRAQVKEALAELRAAATAGKEMPRTPLRSSRFRWLGRLVPRWQFGQHAARA